jgi:transcriptional regulator with XRE-family HTH domain
MSFGEKLRSIRKQVGKSQSIVAQEMSAMFPDFTISQAYISTLEQKNAAPRQEMLNLFCVYFSVELSYFYEDVDVENTSIQKGIDVAENWIERKRNFESSGEIMAHSNGWRREDDEIAESLRRMHKNLDESDEFLDS